MNTIKAIKPGPKPKKPDGTPDRRPRVNPENQPKKRFGANLRFARNLTH